MKEIHIYSNQVYLTVKDHYSDSFIVKEDDLKLLVDEQCMHKLDEVLERTLIDSDIKYIKYRGVIIGFPCEYNDENLQKIFSVLTGYKEEVKKENKSVRIDFISPIQTDVNNKHHSFSLETDFESFLGNLSNMVEQKKTVSFPAHTLEDVQKFLQDCGYTETSIVGTDVNFRVIENEGKIIGFVLSLISFSGEDKYKSFYM